MPANSQIARDQWARYIYARELGHREYVAKANRCEDFFCGKQWDPVSKAKLVAVKRPALTLNTVLSTLASIFGEQIDLATEITFKARYNAPPRNADVLTKVFRCISDDNQLGWLREEVFADGCITSRGYYDVRLKFDQNTAGEVEIKQLNPRSVIPDPDASSYDPDEWSDVIVSTWHTADEIALLYNAEDAKALAGRSESAWTDGADSLDTKNDRFGGDAGMRYMDVTEEMKSTIRGIRVIDRQHRKLSKVKVFVDPKTGDKMQVPDQWGHAEIAHAVTAGGLIVQDELVKRVRWTVTAEDLVLHDDWSPFKRFTVVPFFPHFRYGRTIGVVEGLIDPQELLNKSVSQELHIINTTANSGWKVKKGALANMEIDELEAKGAQTGLVIEVNGNPDTDVVKIEPNNVPTGLDRLSFKAEQYIKLISNRGNNQLGMTRPDQSGKLAEVSNAAADVTLRKVMRNLERTDHLLARNVLELVQNYYTDNRIMHIIVDDVTGTTEEISINLPDPATGEVLNDLSLGTYTTVVTSQKARRTIDENELQEAVELMKVGVPIPPRFLVENSGLRRKGDIIKAMDAEAASPEGQVKKQAAVLGAQLTVAELKAKVSHTEAQAGAQRAKTALTTAQAITEAKGEPGEAQKAEAEMALEARKHEQEMTMLREKHALEMQIKREEAQLKLQIQEQEAAEKRRAQRIESMTRAKTEQAKANAINAHPKEAAPAAAGGGAGPGAGAPGGAQKAKGKPQAQAAA
jgi:hypothetical protein